MSLEQVLRRVWLLAVFGLGLTTAILIALSQWWIAVVAVVALAVSVLFRVWWVSILAAVPAALLGAPVVAGLLAVAGMSKAAWTLHMIRQSQKPNQPLLAAAVDRIEPRLEIGRSGEALTTGDLIAAAVRHGDRKDVFSEWALDRERFDGPLLDPTPVSGPATLYAGEACSLAELVAEMFDVPLTLDLYAASAVVVDTTARSGETAGWSIFEKITGAHPDQALRVLTTFASRRGGGDMTRRLARQYRRRWLGPLS